MTVLPQPLVLAGKTAQVGCRSVRRHGPLVELRADSHVVGHIREGGVVSVVGVTHDIGLSNESSLFEVAVGHVALGIVKGH